MAAMAAIPSPPRTSTPTGEPAGGWRGLQLLTGCGGGPAAGALQAWPAASVAAPCPALPCPLLPSSALCPTQLTSSPAHSPPAHRADYDLYPPYSPKLKCPHGWRTAGDSDKQLVKGVLDDAFYRMVLPAINLDHSRRARAFKCQPGDVVSLHHHHVAGCIEKGGTVRGDGGRQAGVQLRGRMLEQLHGSVASARCD